MNNSEKDNLVNILRTISLKKPQEDIVYNYFSAVYKDIAVSPEKDNRLSLDGFANYFSLPFVITSRLFKLFTHSNVKSISEEEFVSGIMNLYFSDFDFRIRYIFDFFESNTNKGVIFANDIKILLTHFAKIKSKDNDTADLTLLSNLVSNCLIINDKRKTFTKKQWEELVSDNSDVFLLTLFFLYEYKPFQIENIAYFQKITHKGEKNARKIKFPSYNGIADSTELVIKFINLHFNTDFEYKEKDLTEVEYKESAVDVDLLNNFEDDKEKVFVNCFSPIIKEKKPPLIYNTSINNIPKEFNLPHKQHSNGVLTEIKYKRKNYNKEVYKTQIKTASFLSDFRKKNGLDTTIVGTSIPLIQNIKLECLYAPSLYKGTKQQFTLDKLKKCQILLLNNEIVLMKYSDFDSADPPTFSKIINLSNTLVTKDIVTIKDKSYVNISIFSKNYIINNLAHKKTELVYFVYEFFFIKKEQGTDLFCKIGNVISTKSIFDTYDISEQIIEEDNGVVCKGFFKAKIDPCLIKIIRKEKLNDSSAANWEKFIFSFLSRTSNQNLLKARDLYEDINNIYMVYEYPTEGQLLFYLKKAKIDTIVYKLSMLKNILNTIEYLHQFNIVYANQIASNIFIVKDNNKTIIPKLIGYTNAKVLLTDEFVNNTNIDSEMENPPEVKKENKYYKSSDIWEIGILLYIVLYDAMPTISKGKVEFNDSVKCTLEGDEERVSKVNEIIIQCLNEDKDKRINIQSIKDTLEKICN